MTEHLIEGAFKKSLWLGIAVGSLAHLGLRSILPVIVLTGIRYWSLATDNEALWLENPANSGHPVWYALQASVFAGSVVAGILGAYLAPPRALSLLLTLVVVSLIVTAFEQIPNPLSTTVQLVWSGGPCAGLILGVLLIWHGKPQM
jgi:hypothetical protein